MIHRLMIADLTVKQNENKHKVTNCNQLQYAEFNTTSKTRCNNYFICTTDYICKNSDP